MGPTGFPYFYGVALGRRLQPVPWALRVFLGTVALSYGRPYGLLHGPYGFAYGLLYI